MQKITTWLWFDTEAEEAAEFYTSIFPDSRITDIALYGAKNAGRNCTILYEDGMQKDFTKSWLIYKA